MNLQGRVTFNPAQGLQYGLKFRVLNREYIIAASGPTVFQFDDLVTVNAFQYGLLTVTAGVIAAVRLTGTINITFGFQAQENDKQVVFNFVDTDKHKVTFESGKKSLEGANGTQFKVIAKNSSNMNTTFVVFQKPPEDTPTTWKSVAWFSQPVNKGTQVTFKWVVDYAFMWSNSGILNAGVTFDATQTVDGGLDKNNNIVLDYTNNAPIFGDVTSGKPGEMVFSMSENIPIKSKIAIGVAINGSPAFAQNIDGPNIDYTWSITPKYYIAAISNISQGEILGTVSSKVQELSFAGGYTSLDATFDISNKWTVTPANDSLARMYEQLAVAYLSHGMEDLSKKKRKVYALQSDEMEEVEEEAGPNGTPKKKRVKKT